MQRIAGSAGSKGGCDDFNQAQQQKATKNQAEMAGKKAHINQHADGDEEDRQKGVPEGDNVGQNLV